jgi:hypothetical protein
LELLFRNEGTELQRVELLWQEEVYELPREESATAHLWLRQARPG